MGWVAKMNHGKTILHPEDPLFSRSVARLRVARAKDLKYTRDLHICSPQRCDPRNELGVALVPPLTSNVYLCCEGNVHLCTEDACNLYAVTRSCPISGISYGGAESSYDKHDSRTWYAPKDSLVPLAAAPKVRKKAHRGLTDAEVRERADTLIRKLLFSSERVERNKAAITRHEHESQEGCLTYIKRQREAGQLPYFTDEYRVMGNATSQALPLNELRFDTGMCAYLTAVISQTWRIIMRFYDECDDKTAPKVDVESVALGVLYEMRTGLSYPGDCVILPASEFLRDNLPMAIDLPHYKIDRSGISKGEMILSRTYENALNSGHPISEIMLNLDELPQEQGEERVEVLEGDNVPVTITSSGQKLFMPQSRKKMKKT